MVITTKERVHAYLRHSNRKYGVLAVKKNVRSWYVITASIVNTLLQPCQRLLWNSCQRSSDILRRVLFVWKCYGSLAVLLRITSAAEAFPCPSELLRYWLKRVGLVLIMASFFEGYNTKSLGRHRWFCSNTSNVWLWSINSIKQWKHFITRDQLISWGVIFFLYYLEAFNCYYNWESHIALQSEIFSWGQCIR